MNYHYKVDELPEVGDPYSPVCQTGAIGIHSYGLEAVLCDGQLWLVLCFSSGDDDLRQWSVVAVIPEVDARHLLRWMVEAIV